MTRSASPTMPPLVRMRGELGFVLAFLVFSLFLLSQLGTQARFFPRTNLASQPGFWPMVSLIGMSAFSALYAVALLMRPRPSTEWREYLIWLRALEYVLWYLAYAYAVRILGYLPATVLVMPALVWRSGLRSPSMLGAAAGMGLVIVVFFKSILSVRIPGGQVYDLLPPAVRAFMVTHF